MGIPHYFYHIIKNYSQVIKDKNNVKKTSLFIDANSIIYDVVHNNSTTIYKDICIIIEELSIKLNTDKTFVFFDGCVPVAKMFQQKQRRYKSYLTKKILNKNSWNTNKITPGTKFMKDLDTYLIEHFKNNKKINVYGSEEYGEGEQKIFKKIRENKYNNIVVYGLDSDLFMLSLLHLKYTKNIYLYRETKYFSGLSGIKEENDYLFDMNELSKSLQTLFHNKTYNYIEDYCFLCFLCGNDFIPHSPSLKIKKKGIFLLIDIYNQVNKPLIKNNKILWSTLKKIVYELSLKEQERVIECIEDKNKRFKKINIKNDEEKLNYYPLYVNNDDVLIDNYDKYYPIIFQQKDTKTICQLYLSMLEWTFYYYKGECKDYFIHYNFPLAPLFSTLCNEIPCFDQETLLQEKVTKTIPCSLTQLLYVLPYEDAKEEIDIELFENIKKEFPSILNSNFNINTYFSTYLWESFIEFNYLPLEKVNDFINK